MLVVLLLVVLVILYQRQKQRVIREVTSLSRGESSERDLIYRLIKAGVPSKTIFHDLYVPTRGGYTQIDLVVPTNIGVFVFEVKDYSGWIFGDGLRTKWTKVLAYGQEKHQFYNPIMQNSGHIEALKQYLPQLRNVPFFSVVVFYGSSEIKALSNVPENCRVAYPRQVTRLVTNAIANLPPATFVDKWEVIRVLKSAVENGNNPEIVNSQLFRAKMASQGKYKSTYNYMPRFVRKWRRFF